MPTSQRRAIPAVPPSKVRRRRNNLSPSDTMWYWTTAWFHLGQRVIYLGSETTDVEGSESSVDAGMAKTFEISMRALEHADPKAPITVVMNNPGGNWYHGMAIYDRITDSPCHITIIGTGHVMSMGSVILQAADKRLLSRNASILLHSGSNGFLGHAIDFNRAADENKRILSDMEQIYLGRMIEKDPTTTVEKVRQLLQFDSYMDPTKAIKLGLADGLTPRTKHKKKKTTTPPPTVLTPSSE